MNLAACLEPLRPWTVADQRNFDHLATLRADMAVPPDCRHALPAAASRTPHPFLRWRGMRPVRFQRT